MDLSALVPVIAYRHNTKIKKEGNESEKKPNNNLKVDHSNILMAID